jgi:UDP-N-acetylmuramate: L-alanyl-gamma-D-glutamyl-meso-diaminopimelate ligase
MQSTPSAIYSQSADKQRIIVTGANRSGITQFILFVLQFSNRKCDFSTPSKELLSDASVILFEPKDTSPEALEYHHHILIISSLSSPDKALINTLANATPKSGTIIYNEADPIAKEIGKAERVDVFSSAYSIVKHEMVNGKVTLISSTGERFATQLSSKDDLQNISAAKELLKKIGISSGQFYRAIASFQ